MKRLFIAVKIYPDKRLLKTFEALCYALQLEKISWVKPENFHITLKFIGKTPEENIPVIRKVIQAFAAGYSPFNFQLSGTGIFGSSYHPRVIWFGTGQNERLKQLGENILEVMDRAGFSRDRQNFVPHLTVGRIRKINHKKLFQEAIAAHRHDFFQEVRVDKIILFESKLSSAGVFYFPVAEFPFFNS